MPFMVTQASSVMMASPSPVNGAQDLHENLLYWRCGIPGLSNQNELNWTELKTKCQPDLVYEFNYCPREWPCVSPAGFRNESSTPNFRWVPGSQPQNSGDETPFLQSSRARQHTQVLRKRNGAFQPYIPQPNLYTVASTSISAEQTSVPLVVENKQGACPLSCWKQTRGVSPWLVVGF